MQINRYLAYFGGLFLTTIGVALAVKSDLGTAPVSSIPYTITLLTGLEMGKATILFHTLLVLLQILILRKDFQKQQLLQVVIGIVFGYFTTFSNYCVSFLPNVEHIALRIVLSLLSVLFIAFGLFFYVPANLIPLAAEGFTQTVARKTGLPFPRVKQLFDCSLVVISLVCCLLVHHTMGSVGLGTILSAVLVGMVLGWIMKRFRQRLEQFLHVEK